MARSTDPIILARGRLGGLQRWGNADPKAVAEAKSHLQYLLVRREVALALEAEPPLTHVQRRELIDLLLAGGAQ